MNKYLPFFILSVVSNLIYSQASTFDRVYSMLQSNCAAYCHNPGVPTGGLDLTGTKQDVYNSLVNVTPSNVTAAAAGLKRIDPGDARNSFLFKKVNHGLDANLTLSGGEGNAMPNGGAAMSATEREMIRQWINYGAKDTGTFVDEAIITNFYVGQGGQPRIPALAPPAPNEGQQIYWGPIFLPSGQEFEYANKFFLRNEGQVDVTRMNVVENEESHHFALYEFFPGQDAVQPKGMKKVNNIGDEAIIFYNARVIAQWPNSIDLVYPQGTAYVFNDSSIVSITYHLINYNDSIIAAEAYMNIYHTPHQQSTIPIQTDQIRYGGNNVSDLVIFPNGQDSTYVINQFDSDSAFFWNIISMQAHTHALGNDYNVWTRNSNGTKDSIIYDGSYNASYTFDQGVYVWDNPPYRSFSPPLQVDMRKGLIHEATFFNPGPDTVGFGLTTKDEMYVTFIVFYKSEFPNSVEDRIFEDNSMKVYPNPTNGLTHIRIKDQVKIEGLTLHFFDTWGREVETISQINSRYFTVNTALFANGYYTYLLTSGGEVISNGKLAIQR